MPSAKHQYLDLQRLLIVAASGEADEAQWKQLAEILETSAPARDRAVLLLDQMSLLEWRAYKLEESSPLINGRAQSDVPRGSFTAPPIRTIGLLVTGSVATVGLLLLFFLPWSQIAGVASKNDAATTRSVSPAQSSSDISAGIAAQGNETFAAMLIDQSNDALWAVNAAPNEFLLRLPAGRRLELLAGQAWIEFASGAMITLQAPCVLTPTGADSAVLLRGKITGRADNGNFQLSTPTAQVIDLGTEFGVIVDGFQATDVIVFEGEVSVSPSEWGRERADAVYLDVGATVRIDADGELTSGVLLNGDAFLRGAPSPDGKSTSAAHDEGLSLAEVICGGGPYAYLAGSIDPLTGGRDRRPWRGPFGPGQLIGDGLYHPVRFQPMIDGVFIPNSNGQDVVISSDGIRFDFPANEGRSWGPIWGRRRSDVTLPVAANDFWGNGTLPHLSGWLESSRHGLVGIHANVGISFDLAACRAKRRRGFSGFRGTLAKLDLAAEQGVEQLKRHPVRTIDFWVIVDGELRYHKKDLGPNDGSVPFEVALNENDRILTLASTDGGNFISFDNAFLVDPVLMYSPKE